MEILLIVIVAICGIGAGSAIANGIQVTKLCKVIKLIHEGQESISENQVAIYEKLGQVPEVQPEPTNENGHSPELVEVEFAPGIAFLTEKSNGHKVEAEVLEVEPEKQEDMAKPAKRERTPEEKKAWADKMKAAREAKRVKNAA